MLFDKCFVRLKAFLGNIAELDLKIPIADLDGTDKKLPKDISLRDRIVAGMNEDYLLAVLDAPAVIATPFGIPKDAALD